MYCWPWLAGHLLILSTEKNREISFFSHFLADCSMSYFRKSILLFVFMCGVFSAPYASAAASCTSIQAHLTAVIAYCKGSTVVGFALADGYSTQIAGTTPGCSADQDTGWSTVCAAVNPKSTKHGGSWLTNLTSYGRYCPDGANGSPCECKKGTNWQTKSQTCVKSRWPRLACRKSSITIEQ